MQTNSVVVIVHITIINVRHLPYHDCIQIGNSLLLILLLFCFLGWVKVNQTLFIQISYSIFSHELSAAEILNY